MGLGQESDREGEVVSCEAALSAPGRVAMTCQEAPFAAIAQKIGREGLHIMTSSVSLVHEGCGPGHFTVGGADNDLRKSSQSPRHGATGSALEPYTGASRACLSLKTRDKCGLGQLRLDTDGPGPGERQGRRGGELRSRFVGTWTCRDEVPTSTICGYCSKLRERRATYYDCIYAPRA